MDLEKVKQVASLAKLHLGDEECQDAAQKLSQILKHIEKMSNLKTDHVEPLLTPTEIEVFYRSDEVKKEISTEELLENSPSSQGLLFKVPPAVGS